VTETHLPTKRHIEGRQSARESGHGYYSELESFLEFKNGESNGADSPDVKGSANSGDGDSPATHVSDVAKIDHEDRRSVTSEVNPDASTPEPNDIDSPERDQTDDEIAREYREKYGHHDSKTSKRSSGLNSWG
jgi:hypothetical protein